tara:strand:+ start:270 stop:896 length:627 start_codon:yes stop_codon:yes gene_type:complete
MKKHSINMFQVPPLMVFEYEGDMEKLVSHVSNIEYRPSSGNLKSETDCILDDPHFEELKQFCLDCIHEYANNVSGITNEIELQQSWVNLNKPDQSHPEHYHANSFISGVFYLASDQNEGSPIVFKSDLIKNNFSVRILPNKKGDNTYYPCTAPNFTYPSVPGQLILFSSNTSHFVPRNSSKSDRVSLSFNTFPKLPFGSKHGLTYLRG